MLAYTQGITKAQFVTETKRHYDSDNFIRGKYWAPRKGKGCAVGCALESVKRLIGLEQIEHSDHSEMERYLGIPEWLARLEDAVFEGCSEDRSKSWPLDFAKAVNEGADLDRARVPILVMLLEHCLVSLDNVVFDARKFPEIANVVSGSREAVMEMIAAHKSGDQEKIESARAAARVAAWSAHSAAWSAASSAAHSAAQSAESAAWSADSAARRAASSAAHSAAHSAAQSAAHSAESAAWSAAQSAAGAAAQSAAGAASSARSAAFDYYADRIIEILKATK